MNPMLCEIAEAFSHHDFARSYDHLADDVRWHNVGGDEHTGKAAVIDACDAAATYFAGMTITFTSSRTIVGDDVVVVAAAADYLEGGEASTVSSCDLFDVVDDKITAITSYNVEVPPSGPPNGET